MRVGVAAARAVVAAAGAPPNFRGVRAAGAGAAASGAGAAAATGAGGAPAGGRLTGFLTSTVTARVRPWLNFWRTCVSPPLPAGAVRVVVERVSGLLGLVDSF